VTGTAISHYKILRKIGEGGMGVVYEAEDTKLRRRVALKFLTPERVTSGHNRDRFLNEARSAAALNHPNICAIYDVDESAGQLFIVMELCEGESLRALIRKAPVRPAQAVAIALQVASALAEAHRRQIIHRDVKSANIIVDPRNRAWLLDFGLASLGDSTDSTLTIQFMGTPAYMAPERLTLQINDARGDIWALGVVLYEAISGQLPFTGEQAHMIHAILNEHPPALSSLYPDLPPAVDEIIDRALAKDSADRYQRAEEMLAALTNLYRELEIQERPRSQASVTGVSGLSLASAPPAPEPERIRAIAVLPFTNLSRQADDEFLCEGLAEEITNALTQVSGLRVVSRASSSQFKPPAADLRDAGRRLRVGALVLGTLRRQDKRLRVSAQLVKASDSVQIWSRRFDCEMKDVFDLEDQLAGAIVENLRQWLGADLEMAQPRGGAVDVRAHELYLRGRHAFHLQTADSLAQAIDFYTQALEIAPRYALAHAGLADCYSSQAWYGIHPAPEIMSKAKAELESAIAIDEALAPAWRLRAAITAGFDWDWERARAEFQKAFSLGPPAPELRFHYALDYLTPLRRLEEALEEMKMALVVDPAGPLLGTAAGGCLYRLRRYPAALRQLQSTLEISPGFYHAHWSMGRVHVALGSFQEALECFDRAIATGGGNHPAMLADAGHCRAIMGHEFAARQILEQVAGSPLATAVVKLGLGETDAAMEDLALAVKQRVRRLVWLGVDPRFDAVLTHPGFRAVMASMGLT
jgi:serine/threonine protein kinase/Tfp pilus assembly protein PilF